MFARTGIWMMLVIVSGLIPQAQAVSTYTCKTFSLSGGFVSGIYPTAVNNGGQIVGTVGTYPAQVFLIDQNGTHLPFNIPPLFPSGQFSITGLNNKGQLAGYGDDQSASPARLRGFISNSDGSYLLIDPPADTRDQSFGDLLVSSINDDGVVTGIVVVKEDGQTNKHLFTRDALGFFNVLDVSSAPTSPYLSLAPPLLQPKINNAQFLLFGQFSAIDTLRSPDGSETTLTYRGGPAAFYGFNNLNAIVGRYNFPFVMTPDGNAPAVICPEIPATPYLLNASIVNDNGVVVGSVGSGGTIFVATPTGFHSGLQLSNTNWDFGQSPVGQPGGSGVIYVNSNGAADLHIGSVSIVKTGAANASVLSDFQITNSTCESPGGLPGILAPGQFCAISFSFTPQGTGARTGQLVIEDDAPNGPHVIPVMGTGQGKGKLQFSDDYWVFNQQALNTTSGPAVIYIYNPGTDAINFSSIVISDGNTADFAIDANGCGSALPPYTTCAVTLQFAPQATGFRSSTLLFTDDSGSGKQIVPLTGSGY